MTLNRRLLAPKRWTPLPAPPNQGRAAATRTFTITRRIATGGTGPEDIIFDKDGHVLTGLEDGNVLRIDLSTGHRTVIGNTAGRPLGLEPGRDGVVLICDHDKGLLRMSADGSVEVLVDTVAGATLTFASNVVEAPDGTIWFTVSTRRRDAEHYLGEFHEHSCRGLLVRRDPDGTVTVVCDDLKFANGLVLAPDGLHLLFAESAGYRVSRYWLTGPKAHTVEPFRCNLPGLPDNMSLGSDQLLGVGMVACRNALLDSLLPRPVFLRTLVWNIPAAVRPKATSIAWVMTFDLHGRLVHDLRSDAGSYDFVTGVAERNGIVLAASEFAIDIIAITLPGS